MLVLALLLRRRVWNWTSWIFCFFVGRSNRRVWDAFFVLKSLGKQGFEVCRRKKCIDNARVRWLGPVQFFLETYYPKNYHRFWFIPGGLGEPNSKTMPRATSNARRNLFFSVWWHCVQEAGLLGIFVRDPPGPFVALAAEEWLTVALGDVQSKLQSRNFPCTRQHMTWRAVFIDA